MKQWWITDEEIARFTCSTAEFNAIKLRFLQILSFAIKLSKTIEFKRKRAIIRTLSKKIDWCSQNWFFCVPRNILGVFFEKNYKFISFYWNLSEKFCWCFQSWFSRVQGIILAEIFFWKKKYFKSFSDSCSKVGWSSPLWLWPVHILVEILFFEKLQLHDSLLHATTSLSAASMVLWFRVTQAVVHSLFTWFFK